MDYALDELGLSKPTDNVSQPVKSMGNCKLRQYPIV